MTQSPVTLGDIGLMAESSLSQKFTVEVSAVNFCVRVIDRRPADPLVTLIQLMISNGDVEFFDQVNRNRMRSLVGIDGSFYTDG